jgi:NADPH-dependent ferric siderophore reductase
MSSENTAIPVAAGPPTGRPQRPPPKAVEVKRVERLSPHMVNVTFAGPELAAFGWNGPAAHIKVIFASEPATVPGESPRRLMRTYTPRRFDRAALELDVEFVLHGDGPASAWASQAAPGQRLMIGGPGRNYVVDESAEWFLLMGDDSALPAICTILEVLPASVPALVYVEVIDRHEERKLATRANAQVTWLHRGESNESAGQLLEQSLRTLELPAGEGRVYVACESGAMRRIRRHLLTERGLDREKIVTRGYWKLGATDHPDRDYGEDAE